MAHDQEPSSNDHFRVLDEAECLDLLSTTTVGRVAFVDTQGVQLLPLNFTVLDGEIYVRTHADTVLAALAGATACPRRRDSSPGPVVSGPR